MKRLKALCHGLMKHLLREVESRIHDSKTEIESLFSS